MKSTLPVYPLSPRTRNLPSHQSRTGGFLSMNLCSHITISQRLWSALRLFPLAVAPSMDLGRRVLTCVHRYSVGQSGFNALRLLLALPIHPSSLNPDMHFFNHFLNPISWRPLQDVGIFFISFYTYRALCGVAVPQAVQSPCIKWLHYKIASYGYVKIYLTNRPLLVMFLQRLFCYYN